MQIFELHFNPKTRNDFVFDTFIHEPENTTEKKLGGLYMAGDIKNAIPKKSLAFLSNISRVIKKGYYSAQINDPEKSLLNALKKTNEFLSDEVKTGNVNWLGNFNFTALSLRGNDLIFTLSGSNKVVLARKEELIDIGKNLNFKEIEPYPLKVFSNTASGKIAQNDILIVSNKEVFDFLKQKGALDKLILAKQIGSSEIKKAIPQALFEKGAGSKISGFLLLISFEVENGKKKPFQILFQDNKNDDAPKLFSCAALVRKTKQALKFFPAKARIPNVLGIEKLAKDRKGKKRNIILSASFIFLLMIGFLIYRANQKKEVIEIKNSDLEISGLKKIISLDPAELGFDPQGIAVSGKTMYIYNPDSPKVTEINLETSAKGSFDLNENIIQIDISSDTLLLFTENSFFYPSGKSWEKEAITSNSKASSYLSNIYSVDQRCTVLKYPYKNNKWDKVQNWPLNPKGDCSDPKSIAIDGSVWILNRDNSILKYHTGKLEGKISLDPLLSVRNLDKMETRYGIPYLYFLEKKQNRLLITDKSGRTYKEIRENGLSNLKDFSISKDGKTIYLLNGLTVYKLGI